MEIPGRRVRSRPQVQCGLFFNVATAVFISEWLNGLASTHWEKFSSQDYFDKRGVFMGPVNRRVLGISTLWATLPSEYPRGTRGGAATRHWNAHEAPAHPQVFCAPLLALAFCQLINFLRLASKMLIEVKRNEFRTVARERGAEAAAAAPSGPAGAVRRRANRKKDK